MSHRKRPVNENKNILGYRTPSDEQEGPIRSFRLAPSRMPHWLVFFAVAAFAVAVIIAACLGG